MIDLTKITPEQANKIECALLQMEDNFKDKIDAYTNLSQDDTLSAKVRITCKCNAEWWKAVHALIYGE